MAYNFLSFLDDTVEPMKLQTLKLVCFVHSFGKSQEDIKISYGTILINNPPGEPTTSPPINWSRTTLITASTTTNTSRHCLTF